MFDNVLILYQDDVVNEGEILIIFPVENQMSIRR